MDNIVYLPCGCSLTEKYLFRCAWHAKGKLLKEMIDAEKKVTEQMEQPESSIPKMRRLLRYDGSCSEKENGSRDIPL